MKQAVFIDRDGTINEDRGYVYRIENFVLMAGVIEALQALTAHGICIYIVTNQSGIGRGYYTEAQFHELTNDMLQRFAEQQIKIEEVLYCPHHPEATIARYRKICDCRKPGNGLIKRCLEQHIFEKMAMIGDKESDIEAGLSLDLTTYLVRTGAANGPLTTRAHFVVTSLPAAVHHLLATWSIA